MKIRSIYTIGAGGTGSHFIPSAARLMAYEPDAETCTLVIRDGDSFENRNLERQMMRTSDAGTNKAEAMHLEVQGILGDRVSHDPTYINGKEDMFSWMFAMLKAQQTESEHALCVVVLAVDNDMTRKIVYDALDELPNLNVVVIDPGNDIYTGNVNLWLRMEGNEPFLHPRQKYQQLVRPADRVPGGGCAQEVAATPQLITANKQAAVICLHMLIGLLHNESLCEEVMFDLRQYKVEAIGEWLYHGTEEDSDDTAS